MPAPRAALRSSLRVGRHRSAVVLRRRLRDVSDVGDEEPPKKTTRKEEKALLDRLDAAEWAVKALCEQRSGQDAVAEALDLLRRVQDVFVVKLDGLAARAPDAALKADVSSLRKEMHQLHDKIHKLFDPRGRLSTVKREWAEISALVPAYAPPLPSGSADDVWDVTRHILGALPRVLQWSKSTEEARAGAKQDDDWQPLPTAGADGLGSGCSEEKRAFEFFAKEGGFLAELARTKALHLEPGSSSPVVKKPAEILARMRQGHDVRDDLIVLVAVAARAQLGTSALRDKAKRELDEHVRAAVEAGLQHGADTADSIVSVVRESYRNRTLVPTDYERLWGDIAELLVSASGR